ncbi:MAG: GspE/PulE family protein [Candidatus Saccharimonadales bacterium]
MSDDPRLSEEQASQRRARLLGFDYLDTSQSSGHKQIYVNLINIGEMRELKALPVLADANHITFGILNTTPQSALKQLTDRFNDRRVNFALISETGFREYMNLYDPPKEIVYHDIELKDAGSSDLIERISTILNEVRADDMLAYLVSQAHRLNSSDIHIETQAGDVRIRIRIDGVLHVIARLPFDKYRVLLAAIASAGNISTGANEAQQGHIAQKVKMADGTDVDVNVRLETVPTINGIDIVMRLFNMDEDRFVLDKLGLSGKERAVVDAIIAKPSGLVMVVGPTGSGKTTTLYSILNSLNNEQRKIITIEDPVEFQFRGITQIPVHSSEVTGSDTVFADKLRAVLRLDPDVVMVGEIRDQDTARTALQASLTGHLVLTTFHASNASAALTRLADIIGQNPLFVSAIRLIMAQRLVRRLDDNLRQAYDPSDEERRVIQGVIDTLPNGVERPNLGELKLYRPGSSEENPYGYSGLLAIREQLTMTDAISKVITTPGLVVGTEDIERAAVSDGMITMLHDAILKVVAGLTTLEEVFRVIG